jgi:Raf kinase inhibitor-like YbhB/YbcL family protein
MRSFIAVLMLASASVSQGAESFQVSSPDIPRGTPLGHAQEYNGFGCKGANVSPALNWKGAPKGTKSYAVTMHDPDAPTGSGWWHWIMIDIPGKETGLARDAGNPASGVAPAGSGHRRNDFGASAYGGACPPPGDAPHHYHIKVFALDVERLDVPADGSAALVGYMLQQHALGKAEILTTYRR